MLQHFFFNFSKNFSSTFYNMLQHFLDQHFSNQNFSEMFQHFKKY
jgi:hypothetical protein